MTDSPLADRMIFNVGARRSGTLWLQRIVSAHPAVSAIPNETHLFELGLAPLMERFHHGARSSTTVGQLFVEPEALRAALRAFCDGVLAGHLEPGARYLAERSPQHVKHVGLIGRVFPDARFIHIIRDGRDVARSQVARSWGPGSVAEAAEDWRHSVASAREAAAGVRYREVRYEALLTDPEREIAGIYEWLELPAGPAELEAAMTEAGLARNEDPNDPRLMVAKWREHLSAEEVAAFEAVAGDLLEELGYERAAGTVTARAEAPAEAPAPPPAPRPPMVRRLAGRARRMVAGGTQTAPAAPEAPSYEIGGHLAEALKVVDAFLTALHGGRIDAIRELLDPRVTLNVTDPAGTRSHLGPDALLAELRADPAWTGRQVRGDTHPGAPTFSVVLAYELPDGSRADRVLNFVVNDARVQVLALYRFGG